MNESNIDLGVFVRLFDKLTSPLRKMESGVAASTTRMNKRLSLSVKLAGAGVLAAGIAKASRRAVTAALEPVRAVEKAKGELASLGIENLGLITGMGKKMEAQWAGVTADAFTSAAYDIKSGISSLTDEGVADMTRAAVTVAKATKGVPEEMTSLFATGYGIFKDQYQGMKDADFGALFGDMISASVQQFKTDGSQMQAAIESAGKGATNLGLEMADQMTILGSLQAVMSGSEAGTALKAFAANSAKADAAFGKMQISTDRPVRVRILDENNMMRAMPDILADMSARYGDTLDAAERFEIQQALGSEEAIKLIDQLYGQDAALRTNADALEAAAASGGKFTASMAAAVDNNWDSKLELYSQKFNVIKMSIGEGMLPMLEALEPAITTVTDAVVGFMDENPLAAQIIGITVIALAGLASVAAPVLMGMAAMTLAAPGMAAAFGIMGTAIGVVGGAIKAVTLTLLANPIILIIAAIALAAYLIYDNWDAIAAFFIDIWDQIKAAWGEAGTWFGEIWSQIKGAWGEVSGYFAGIWENVSGAFSAVFTVIKALVMTFTPAGLIYKHWDVISGYFGGIWDGVKAVFGAYIDWSVAALLNFTPAGLIYKHWDRIAGYFGARWDEAKGVFIGVFDWAKAAFMKFHPAGLIYTHWDVVSGYFGGIWDGVKSVFTAYIDWSVAALLNFTPAGLIYQYWDEIPGWFSGLWGGVTGAFTDNWSTIESAAEGNFNPANMIFGKWNSLAAWFGDLWGRVRNVFAEKWSSISAMVATWPAAMRQAGSDIVNGIIAGITAKWTALRNKVVGMGSAIKGWFGGNLEIKSPSRVFMRMGGHIADGLGLGIGAGEESVMARVDRLARRIARPIAAPPIAAPRLNFGGDFGGKIARAAMVFAAPAMLAAGAPPAPAMAGPVAVPMPQLIEAGPVAVPMPQLVEAGPVAVPMPQLVEAGPVAVPMPQLVEAGPVAVPMPQLIESGPVAVPMPQLIEAGPVAVPMPQLVEAGPVAVPMPQLIEAGPVAVPMPQLVEAGPVAVPMPQLIEAGPVAVPMPQLIEAGPVAVPMPQLVEAGPVAVPMPQLVKAGPVSIPDLVLNAQTARDVPIAPIARLAGRDIAPARAAISFSPTYNLTVTAAAGASPEDLENTREMMQELLREMADEAAANIRRQLHD